MARVLKKHKLITTAYYFLSFHKFTFFILFLYYLPKLAGKQKRQYLGQAITPACFQKYQDIAVWLKFLIWFFSFTRDMNKI